jgi:hypothetical protein
MDQQDLFDPDVVRSLLDQFLDDARLYTLGKDYNELLDFVVRLRNFAPFNAMLLQVQKPGLRFAASARATSLGLSLLRNRRLAAKDILLDLARRCFWQLGYEVNFLRRLEVRQMITSIIAQLGFRRGRACF